MSEIVEKTGQLEPKIHHTFWYYRRYNRGNLLDHITCNECRTSYPSSSMLKDDHPSDEFTIEKTIKHIAPRRK